MKTDALEYALTTTLSIVNKKNKVHLVVFHSHTFTIVVKIEKSGLGLFLFFFLIFILFLIYFPFSIFRI